ncbi:50S ribosomal protein L10 [Candidatus Endowatersipora endosymbiont of Watersipora subatra]|uniref:50S ribosomal protein L10 n=1 Tax=Candidatus Endowatersipora endosymbiont of Watersipora subatra TaxID=3077946 RepID=UPI00312C920C
MDRLEKQEFVKHMRGVLSSTGTFVVAHYAGLTVADITELRSNMREGGGKITVAKNSLIKLALKGTEMEYISDLFSGPTLIAYSDDPIAAPKVTSDFAKENNKFSILGGAMGAKNLDDNDVKLLAAIPSLDKIRAKIIGILKTPSQAITILANAPALSLVRLIGLNREVD